MAEPTCIYGKGTCKGVCGRRYQGVTLTTNEGTTAVCSWPVKGGTYGTHPWTPEPSEQPQGETSDR